MHRRRSQQETGVVFLVLLLMPEFGCGGRNDAEQHRGQPRDEVVIDLYPYHSGGQWGYIDRSGRVRIPAQFDWAADFREGRAGVAASDPKEAGYIRTDGTWAVRLPPGAFPYRSFSEGRVWFRQGATVTCVDRDGRFAFDRKFESADDFSEGLAAVRMSSPSGSRARGSQPYCCTVSSTELGT